MFLKVWQHRSSALKLFLPFESEMQLLGLHTMENTHFLIGFCFFILSKYNGLIILCEFLLYSKVTQIHMCILLHILFHCGLSQDTEYSSLCHVTGPSWLSILYTTLCLCNFWNSANSRLSTLPPRHPAPTLCSRKSVLCIRQSAFVSYICWFVSKFRFHT